jgi:hypothetical protein
MRTFRCACGARTFFDNTRCLTCGRELGFLADALALEPLDPEDDDLWATSRGEFRKCANYVDQGVCNWMVESGSQNTFCRACDFNRVIPDLSRPENRALWLEVERAKRRLVYTLARLKLPVRSRREDPQRGLAFDIKADEGDARVLTGHADGLVTLNLAEADPAEREKIRVAMKERYRTLLGHFRHEVGHYYWDSLVRETPDLLRFRAVFGDETASYAEALKAHYGRVTPHGPGPAPDHAESYITSYAAAHPWEDFAETFAHYLHLQDTLDTALAFGFTSRLPAEADVARIDDFELLISEWIDLSIALNVLNRSMGQPDAYPFAITDRIKEKLGFVHAIVAKARSVVPVSAARAGAGAAT